ncbi:hypothetical protein D3C85_1094810 [compost metagenome]
MIEVLKHRLDRADDEGQADEDHGHDHADGGVGDLDAQRRQQAADGSVLGVEGGQGDAGHGGRQSEGQVDHRVGQPLAGEVIAGQHPGQQAAHDRIDGGGDGGGDEAEPQGRLGAGRGDGGDDAIQPMIPGSDRQGR